MASSARLATLPDAQRNKLEQLLMRFDQQWKPDLLGKYTGKLNESSDESMRQLAVAELVKIDIQRRWASGAGQSVEDYLQRMPELGSAETVDPEVIFAEYLARRQIDSSVTLDRYADRFPQQFDRLGELAGEHLTSDRRAEGQAQASIETSRVADARDTATRRDTDPIDLPIEFGRYRILRELGAGAMGKVYLAHDSQLDRQVALKTPSFQGAKDDELIARFYREARAAAKLQHRNICPIYDVGEIEGRHFISMGFIKGRCMAQYIAPGNLPPPKTAAVLVHRVASGLAEAHRHNIVHRDLKPANIMVDTKREPVVMDFGLARDTDTESRMTQSGMLVGTPAYMSPEQVGGDPDQIGPATDIYSLGVILYELLTGKLPFTGSIVQVVHQITSAEATPPSQLRAEVDPELEAVCAKMMAKDRAARFQTMDEAAAALKDYLKRPKPTSASPASTESSPDAGAAAPEIKTDGHTASKSGGLTETEALNAYFAAQQAGQTQHDNVDLNVAVSQPRHALARSAAKPSRRNRAVPWVAGFGASLLVALSLLLLIRTPHGTVRVEVDSELDGLEVLVDGETISLQSEAKLPAREHQLALKLNGTEMGLDPKSNQFVVTRSGDEPRLVVSIGDVQLASKSFTVTKNQQTVLKIQLLPASRPEETHTASSSPEQTPAAASSPARAAAAGSPTSEPGLAIPKGPSTASIPAQPAVPLTIDPSRPPSLVKQWEHTGVANGDTLFAAISADGKQIAHRMGNVSLQMIDLSDGATRQVPTNMQHTRALVYSADGRFIATGDRDGHIRIWDASSLTPLGPPFVLSSSRYVHWVSISSDGSRLLALASDRNRRIKGRATVCVWDVNARKLVSQFDVWTAHLVTGMKIDASADGGLIVVAGDKSVGLWNTTTGQRLPVELNIPQQLVSKISSVDLSEDGSRVAYGLINGSSSYAAVLDTASGREVWKTPKQRGRVYAVKFTPHGAWLAGGTAPNEKARLVLWDAKTGKMLFHWNHPFKVAQEHPTRVEKSDHSNWIRFLSFSQDGSKLLSTGWSAPICLWSIPTTNKSG